MDMSSHKLARWFAGVVVLLAVAGCTRTDVQQKESYGAGPSLARPDVIVIHDFGVSASDVKLDQGVLQRMKRLVSSDSATAQQDAAAAKLVDAVSAALAQKVGKLGFTVVRAAGPAAGPVAGNQFSIAGQFLVVDEGNQTRRNIIGLGAGGSEVQAATQFAYQPAGAQPQMLQSFTTTAKSSRKPGAAETLGAGAAIGVAAATDAASETMGANVDALGAKMADEIVKQLVALAKQQGWAVNS